MKTMRERRIQASLSVDEAQEHREPESVQAGDHMTDHRLFPAIYTDGSHFYTVSDGQAWKWIRVGPAIFGAARATHKGYWYARKVKRMPPDCRYACQVPEELQAAVKRKGGELHRYDLHEGKDVP